MADVTLRGDRPEFAAAVEPLLREREAAGRQIVDLDRKVRRLAKVSDPMRRLMTAPGAGPITALCYRATIDAPIRFDRSRNVGAYLGLTIRRHASGEVDWTGRISKCGDAMLRLTSEPRLALNRRRREEVFGCIDASAYARS